MNTAVGALDRSRLDAFVADSTRETPYVVVDLDIVRERYQRLATALPAATIFYAVKANPAPEILAMLAELGSCFDVASPGEVDECLALGVSPDRISYGNTVKKFRDIAYAYDRGVRVFTFDAVGELDKLVAAAPGSTVVCRLACSSEGADWPLSRKFGTTASDAAAMLRRAAQLGMRIGVSFHVGSQQRNLHAWDRALEEVAHVESALAEHGLELDVINLGGGFPGTYRESMPQVEEYGEAINAAIARRVRNPQRVQFMAEPGRYLVADAGVLCSEVVLVAQRPADGEQRWIYLDVGMFGGLAETMGEAIRYPIRTDLDGTPSGPVALAGPTCDSADVLYEHTPYELPLALAPGDRVYFASTGAYTTSYSSVGFNGFAPLRSYYLAARALTPS